MEYYFIDKENNTKLKAKVSGGKEQTWIKENGKEIEVSPKSNSVVDVMLLNKPISKEEYDK